MCSLIFQSLGPSALLPDTEVELGVMLRAYLLHRMVRELGDELGHSPNRVRIPLQGILSLLQV